LDLELIAPDTPGKVLANITVHMAFRLQRLIENGGYGMLKTPSLKLPVCPKSVSNVSAFSWNEEAQDILEFVRKADKVAYSLQKVYDATVMALAARPQDAPEPNHLAEIVDDVSTSDGHVSAVESLCGSSTTESCGTSSMTMDQASCLLLAPQSK
jgi:hypothetical protein